MCTAAICLLSSSDPAIKRYNHPRLTRVEIALDELLDPPTQAECIASAVARYFATFAAATRGSEGDVT